MSTFGRLLPVVKGDYRPTPDSQPRPKADVHIPFGSFKAGERCVIKLIDTPVNPQRLLRAINSKVEDLVALDFAASDLLAVFCIQWSVKNEWNPRFRDAAMGS